LPANVRLGWKRMAVANTLAYYDTATIMAIKSFIVQATEPSVKKRYSSVIYGCL
jgi:hypothetical protein